MKQLITYLMATVMSALMLYGGGGLNVYRFCCDGCRSHGVEAIAKTDCCGHTDDDADCCSFERISFDWDMQTTAKFVASPPVIDVDLSVCDLSAYTSPSLIDETADLPNAPPLIPPRDYLSRLTVLLI